jgi:hypothetical protein
MSPPNPFTPFLLSPETFPASSFPSENRLICSAFVPQKSSLIVKAQPLTASENIFSSGFSSITLPENSRSLMSCLFWDHSEAFFSPVGTLRDL